MPALTKCEGFQAGLSTQDLQVPMDEDPAFCDLRLPELQEDFAPCLSNLRSMCQSEDPEFTWAEERRFSG